jgi:hypothetical protein
MRPLVEDTRVSDGDQPVEGIRELVETTMTRVNENTCRS